MASLLAKGTSCQNQQSANANTNLYQTCIRKTPNEYHMSINKPSATRDERWEREAKYFASIEYDCNPLPHETIERYKHCRRPFHSAEYPFVLLGDVRGKRILDIGCGDGTRSILLALKGAQVVGIDLSKQAIAAARARAYSHAVSEAAEFICCPLELYTGVCEFDVIIGWNILHHLICELSGLLVRIQSLGKVGCSYLFYEPVNLSPLLRRVRLMMPVPVVGSPDERPLETPELEIIRGGFYHVDIVYFGFAVRLFSRFILKNSNYEESSRTRRFAHDALGHLDWFLLRALHLSKLASTAVIFAHARDVQCPGNSR
jgi:2-polyprenyl-3-methyl-5-hydroxy-6-metoxy-1,4-benzoquinol methylase